MGKRAVKLEVVILAEDMDDQSVVEWIEKAGDVFCDFLACNAKVLESHDVRVLGVVEDDSGGVEPPTA